MKTLIRIVAVTIASLIFIHACATTSKANFAFTISFDDSLNKLKAAYPVIYENLIKEFKKIENLKYAQQGDALYLAFNNDNNRTNAVFSFDGKCRYTITEGNESLPKEIIAKIKTQFPSHTIFSKKMITVKNEIIYQVIIENKEEYRTINFSNEEMEEQQKIKKIL